MSVIQVPYHLDEYLPDLDFPLPPDAVITPDLPAGDEPPRVRWRLRCFGLRNDYSVIFAG